MSNYRHENKYRIDSAEEMMLRIKAEGAMGRDPYAGSRGFYYIRSLYFDDLDNNCVFDTESGVGLRSKFRMRYYNDDRGYVRLEKKSKITNLVIKESCLLNKIECDMLVRGEIPLIEPDMPEIKKKMFSEMQLRCLYPKVIVSYERIPFVYDVGNVRLTFDRNITSSDDTEFFLQGNYSMRPVMQQGYNILEIKWNELLPIHIRDVMLLDSLCLVSFSKYCMCGRYHL